jgi:dTDP-4-amino-4,6-dideoxygalactose transaminase
MATVKPIPLIEPLLPDMRKTMKYYQRSINSGMLSNFGPCFDLAVEKLHTLTGRHILPVTNGAAAIQVAAAVTLNSWERVAIPDYTHIGTYSALKAAGFDVRLVKASEKTWAIDLDSLKENVNYFDSLVVVSPFGVNVDIAPYEAFARVHRKKIIYDFAGAWGQFPKTMFPVCYSLHATKNFTTGEGGLVSFATHTSFELGRIYSNFGIGPSGDKIFHDGHNLKMDDLRCAMIAAHIDFYHRIENRTAWRAITNAKYRDALGGSPIADSPSLCVLPNQSAAPHEFSRKFKSKYYYPLLSRMNALKEVQKLSESSDYFTRCLALPIDVKPRQQDMIIRTVKKYVD